MILHGNQRGGAKNLALHLLKEENEHVEIHELRGFVSEDLISALNEAYAISRGTRCRQFLYSLSLNPPPGEKVGTEVFEDAIERIEQKLGLMGQPRAIVFHEKEGRRHCHAVWSRINDQKMKAVPLPHTKRKLQDIARALYLEQGWKMPRGFMSSKERDPRNFTLGEWQKAKRGGMDPRAIKRAFQECWAVSDTQSAFAQALKERGYVLARGDRRGFVALDHRGEVYAVSKWVGIRTKQVRAKLKDEASLPSVSEARSRIASDMATHLRELEKVQATAFDTRMAALQEKRKAMARDHRTKRQALANAQETRWREDTQARQKRFNKGFRGLFDLLTGQRQRVKEQNEREAYMAALRDRQEKDELIFRQLEERCRLRERIVRLKTLKSERTQELGRDIAQYDEMETQRRERFVRQRRIRTPAGPSRV